MTSINRNRILSPSNTRVNTSIHNSLNMPTNYSYSYITTAIEKFTILFILRSLIGNTNFKQEYYSRLSTKKARIQAFRCKIKVIESINPLSPHHSDTPQPFLVIPHILSSPRNKCRFYNEYLCTMHGYTSKYLHSDTVGREISYESCFMLLTMVC